MKSQFARVLGLGAESQASSRREQDNVYTEKMLTKGTQAKIESGAAFYPTIKPERFQKTPLITLILDNKAIFFDLKYEKTFRV